MVFQFNPLVFGAMLVVALGTAAYTYFSNRQTQSYEAPQSHAYAPTNYDTTKEPPRKRKNVGECRICSRKLVGPTKTLPCRHEFHIECINRKTCPLCTYSRRM